MVAQFQLTKFREAQSLGAQFRQASVALDVQVNDADVWPYMERPATDSAPAVAYLRDHHLAMFAAGWTHWTGQALQSLFAIGNTCGGSVDQVLRVGVADRPGWRVSGRVPDQSVEDVLLVGPEGTIQGIGKAVAGQWYGYARMGPSSVTAYAVKSGTSVCPLGARELH
jgi:hypothetical protein